MTKIVKFVKILSNKYTNTIIENICTSESNERNYKTLNFTGEAVSKWSYYNLASVSWFVMIFMNLLLIGPTEVRELVNNYNKIKNWSYVPLALRYKMIRKTRKRFLSMLLYQVVS